MVERQSDLFDAVLWLSTRAVGPSAVPVAATGLSDEALVAALPLANRGDAVALAAEAVRRRLSAAVPALEALCRRFKGFGEHRVISEQSVAVDALAALGGAGALTRILVDQVVEGPGVAGAVAAAALAGCKLPPSVCGKLLRHAEPAVRAAAARIGVPHRELVTLLVDLLDDLHDNVALAAACALGRMGRIEGRSLLLARLRVCATPELIEAIGPVADEACVVALNLAARANAALRDQIFAVLDDIGSPLASRVSRALESLPKS
ncbi:MAG TPA: hypothetical protein VMB71_01980 [Acetobacteraceae bacterium]|nr:hypothetical protein [Acetobacteraceae bacterium]